MSKRRARHRRFWRRVRSLCWTAVFLLIVGAAVLTGIGRLLAPYADRMTPHLNRYLSTQLETRVDIREVSAGWQGAQPHLALSDVTVGGSGEALQLAQVRLQFDPLTWFRFGRNSVRMEIVGADLLLTRSDSGAWILMGQGLDSRSDSNAQQLRTITTLLRRADVQLVDARIRLHDQASDYRRVFDLPRVSIAQVPEDRGPATGVPLNTEGSRFQMIARLHPDGDDQAGAILRLMVQAGEQLESLRGYFQTQRQALQPWLAIMPESFALQLQHPTDAEAELWFDWAQAAGLNVRGHVQLSAAAEASADGNPPEAFMAADILGRYARLDGVRSEWALNLENLAFARNSLRGTWLEVGNNAAGGWSLASGPLPLRPLQTWQQWLLPDSGIDIGLFGELQQMNLAVDAAGQVLSAELGSDAIYLDAGDRSSATQAADAADATMLCGPLQLQMSMQDQFGRVSLASEAGVCDIPGFTREPFLLEQLQLELQLEQHGADWFAHWLPSYWDSGDFRLALGGRAAWQQDGIWLDVEAGIDSILATRVKHYLPYQEQPKGAREWIERSMQGGYWRDIRASLRGRPQTWPLPIEQGQFVAGVSLEQVELHYGRNWPPARNVSARVEMQADGLRTHGASADLSGVPVSGVDAAITELIEHPVLDLTAQLNGDASTVLDLMGEIPLGGTGGLAERDFDLTGPVSINANVGLDLRERSRLIYAGGQAQLQAVRAHAGLLEVHDINGALGFDDVGVRDSDLRALWGEHPSQVRWRRSADGSEIHLQGRYPAAHIIATALPDQPAAQELMHGDSDWLLRLLIGRDTPRALLTTDLLGTEVRLPAPLEKFATVAQPLVVDWELGDGERRIGIDYADTLQLRMLQNAQRHISGASAQFVLPGDARPPPAVQPGKVMLTGATEIFDPLGWMGLASQLDQGAPAGPVAARPASAPVLTPELHLRTDQLLMERRALGRTRLDYAEQMASGMDGVLEQQRMLTLEGDNVSGQVSFDIGEHDWTIDANLERLNVPRPLVASSQPSGRELLTEDRPPAADEERIDWLTLHLICDDLTWHGVPLGQTRIEVLPRFDGMVIDTLEARSDVLTLTGSGGWRRNGEGVKSTLNLRLDADDTGDLLEAMGYERLVEGSQLTLDLESSWPGSIGELNLKRMDGKLTLEAGAGNIPKAAPGAGRVLGLISLQALPRRLFLDFSDVFAEGLDFDRAGGILIFHAGIARTSGIVIDAAAAEITITGETDLVRAEYDQIVTVRPGVGVALPILGAIAGGPIGVGAGFALQGLLSIGGVTEIRYAVTGPWDEPELRALADEPTVTQPLAGNPATDGPLPAPPGDDDEQP